MITIIFITGCLHKVQFFIVKGNSMEPSFQDGSICICIPYVYTIGRGDVIICQGDNKEKFIKRVIAVAGDKIYSRHGNLYLNDERMQEDYVTGRTDISNIVIPEDCVFVLGDNREDSCDSREFGVVSLDDICGIAYKLP